MASTITSFSKEDVTAVTMAGTDPKTDLTNGRAVNWAPEVVFSPFRAL